MDRISTSQNVSHKTIFACALIMLFLCFYFSISVGLFLWLYPDEPAVSMSYHNFGFLGCVKNYYLHTTINRFGADINFCSMAMISHFFPTLYSGWVIARFVFYAFVPIAILFFFKKMLSMSYKSSLLAALLISALGFFMLNGTGFFLFGASLSIYVAATVTFILLVALLPSSVEGEKSFLWFCIIFALNLTCHEIFLAVSGFFIPVFAWYRQSQNKGVIREALKDQRVLILSSIYVVCAVIIVFAPGVGMRQKVWPSTGTPMDALAFIIFVTEECVYLMVRSYAFVAAIMLIGLCAGYSLNCRFIPKKKLLLAYFFIAPFIYICVTSILLGITPSLWGGSIRPESFRIFDHYFASLVSSPAIMKGGFAIRQFVFVFFAWLIDLFLIGLLLGQVIRNTVSPSFKGENYKVTIFQLGICGLASVLFLTHPDGMGSLRIIPALFRNVHDPIVVSQYQPQTYYKSHPEQTILGHILRKPIETSSLEKQLFRRNIFNKHEPDVVYVIFDEYLRKHHDQIISHKLDDLLYAFPPLSNYPLDWKKNVYSDYHIKFQNMN
jgi:hypothetical protein